MVNPVVKEFLRLKQKEVVVFLGVMLGAMCVVYVCLVVFYYLLSWIFWNYYHYTLVPYPICLILGGLMLLGIDWIRSNWKQAKENVRRKDGNY